MRSFERRANLAFPYYKLATWCPISMTWKDGKKAFPNVDAAKSSLPSGRYRISEVTDRGRTDMPPFEV